MTKRIRSAHPAAPAKTLLHVPFARDAVAAFALAAQKNGGHFELTETGELAIRFPDGRVIVFDGSRDYPALLTPESLQGYNEHPAALIGAAQGALPAQDVRMKGVAHHEYLPRRHVREALKHSLESRCIGLAVELRPRRRPERRHAAV